MNRIWSNAIAIWSNHTQVHEIFKFNQAWTTQCLTISDRLNRRLGWRCCTWRRYMETLKKCSASTAIGGSQWVKELERDGRIWNLSGDRRMLNDSQGDKVLRCGKIVQLSELMGSIKLDQWFWVNRSDVHRKQRVSVCFSRFIHRNPSNWWPFRLFHF